jgi:probable rRNA maturation factor
MNRPDLGDRTSFEVIINEGDCTRAPVGLLERAVRIAVGDASLVGGEVSVTLLVDSEIQELNRDYLSKDRPTDVIAFSLGGDDSLLGDVYIGFEQAERQAREVSVDRDEELARLAIHGTLHVMGHDHPEGADRVDGPMFEIQERLLRELLADTGNA